MKNYKTFLPEGFRKTAIKPKFPFDICDRCEHINPKCYCEDAYVGSNYVGRNIIVYCRHENKCRRLYRMISDEVNNKLSGGDGVDKTLD